MTETSLSQAINKLAEQKARQFNEKCYVCLQNSVKEFFRQHDEWTGDAVKAVLKCYLDALNAGGESRYAHQRLPAHPIVVQAVRGQILKEILEKLPLIRELDDLADDVEAALQANDPNEL